MGRQRTVVLSDIHSHHHSPSAVEAARLFVVDYAPEVIFFAGDIFDFEAPSRYAKAPEALNTLQAEIDIGVEILAQFRRAAPTAAFVFIAGNHEDRLQSFLIDKGASLRSLRCLDYIPLLGLDKLNFIAAHPYGHQVRYHGCLIEHGDLARKGGGATAKGMIASRGMNGISGHVHRLAHLRQTTTAGRRWWIENGCLCDLHPTYCKSQPDWQHGFSFGEVNSRGRFEARAVEVVNGEVIL